MRNMLKSKKILKKIVLIIILLYILSVLINQQKTLNSYKAEQEYIAEKIEENTEYNKALLSKQDNITSAEYIETVAREKLDMYTPNERVYIDIGK